MAATEGVFVADLFEEYELLASSGLFDAEYYVGANPDVAALSIDPLMHYLERGANELRDPSKAFNARHYAQLCQQRGEPVDNPLLHYIQVGAAQGLMPRLPSGGKVHPVAGRGARPPSVTLDASEFLLRLEQVRIEPGRGGGRLIGTGWCLAANAVAGVEVALGAIRTRARYGLPRADVALIYPQYLKSDQSGFEFNLGPISKANTGIIELEISVTTAVGATAKKLVPIDLGAVRSTAQLNNGTVVPDAVRNGLSRPPMQLCIDSAEVDDAGILHIVGWAVCLAPISSLQIFIDEQQFAAADYGIPREDVASSHGEYPNARDSGFALHTDITSLGDGDRLIKVRAIAATGIFRETILAFTLSAAHHGSRDRAKSTLQCNFDHIEVTAQGLVSISGWAVAAGPIERISALLDGNEIGDAEIGIKRPDVGKRYLKRAHARRAGFSFRCSVRAISGGEHLILLRFHAGGNETDVPLPVLTVPGTALDAARNTPSEPRSGELLLSIDLPQVVGGTVVNPIRGNLEIAGWALARSGIGSIAISIDGERLKTASTGIRRIDVQRAFPGWEGALTAGFSTLFPHRSLPHGAHTVSVALYDKDGHTAKSDFQIVVEEAPDTDGPWALRRRMSPPEIDLMTRPLLCKATRPSIAVLLVMPSGAKALELTRATLSSLGTQVYAQWRFHIVTRAPKPAALRRALLKRLDELSDRVEVSSHAGAVDKMLAARDAASHLMVLRPGDELGCDAVLEFATQTVLHPKADLFYCDERRLSHSSGKIETFFKPQWSPDLLLSQNYLGRAWCASTALLRCMGFGANELLNSGSYHLALRLTEQAAAIQHVPATLVQINSQFAEDEASERKALERALFRRGLAASVTSGRTRGTFRVKRKVATPALVSIIIPTCAARGLVRNCIETLGRLTKYRNFEIVCIENIPADKQEWKDWLRANADRVIHTAEPFNWSRFNNLAVAASRGEFLLFLNDDTEVIDPRWLEVLLENAQRPDVGAVGPQLLYPDRRVQHSGMFLAGRGIARHAFRHAAEDDPGYFGLALTQRNVIAVTGACLMTRRETFKAFGGFDEGHDIVNNDVDYCLRVWRGGLHTIYTPHTKLIHHEQASRADIADRYDVDAFESKWRNVFAAGDPYFHPRLTKDRDDYSFEWEPVEVHCVGHPVLPHANIRRILIVKLDHIGDCVTALPAIRRLKHHFPEAKLSVLTGRASKSVWALEPAVDEVMEFDFFNARSSSGLVDRSEDDWRELRERLAPHCFDLAIDLRKHWETRPVLRHTGARYFAGFDMKNRFPWLDVALEWSEDSALLRKRQHTSADLVNLIDAVAAASETDRAVIVGSPPPLSQVAHAIAPMLRRIFRKRVICVHPSSGNEMKRWPAEYFSLLIDQLVEAEKVHVILVGGPDEAAVGAEVLTEIKNHRSVWSLIGKLTLGDLPAVIARCALFVGNDSGPKHIAAGLGVPTVGIHSGVVDAREWGPMGSIAVAIDRVMTCAPCYLLKIEDCGRGLACLRGLLPADVMRVCQRLLAASSADPTPGRHGSLQAEGAP